MLPARRGLPCACIGSKLGSVIRRAFFPYVLAIAAAPGAALGACGGPSSNEKEEAGADASSGGDRSAPDDGATDAAEETEAGPPSDADRGDGLSAPCSAFVPCASPSQYCNIDCVLEMTRGFCTELPAACQGVATCGCVPTACGDAGLCEVPDGGGLVAGCPCRGPH